MAKITKSLGTQFSFAALGATSVEEDGRCAHFFLAFRFGISGAGVRARFEGAARRCFGVGERANTLELLCN
jgi:hypothetical protein